MELVDYGLLVKLGTDYEVSHPLIHTYARQRLQQSTDAARSRELVARLVTVLAAHFPAVEVTTWVACERLVPHIRACAIQLEQQRQMLVEAASVFSQAGNYLEERGRYEQAEEFFARALVIREQVLEPEHPDLSNSLDRLATIYWHRGKYEQAEPLYQRALVIDEKILGPEHPETATTLYCLAYLCQQQGRNQQAESFYQRALAIYEQALPLDHPYIAGILSHYASLLIRMNRPHEAQALEQRANAIQTRHTT